MSVGCSLARARPLHEVVFVRHAMLKRHPRARAPAIAARQRDVLLDRRGVDVDLDRVGTLYMMASNWYHDGMKERSQVQFDPEQARLLKQRAARDGVSISAVVRDAVTAYLAESVEPDRLARLLAADGQFRSGSSDVSQDHDRYLIEDFS
jgi:hypothetical protein